MKQDPRQLLAEAEEARALLVAAISLDETLIPLLERTSNHCAVLRAALPETDKQSSPERS